MFRSATAFALIATFGTALVGNAIGAPQEADRPEGAPLKSFVPEEPVRIPIKIVNGRPVVEAKIDGQGPFTMIVDTGAGMMFLDRRFAMELGLESEGEDTVGIPGGPQLMPVEMHTIDSLEIGGARFEGLAGMSHDDDMMRQGLGAERGVIGLPTFTDCLVTIDYHTNELVIRRGALAEGDGSIAYRADEGVPTIAIDVAGTMIEGHIDSGGPGGITLPARYETLVPLSTPVQVVGRGRTVSGEFEVRAAKLDGELGLGGHRIENPDIHFNDMFAVANVGARVLSQFAVTIDQTNERMLFAAPAGPIRVNREVPRRSYGIMLAMGPTGPIDVRGAVPGSIAERAGLQAGDRIVAMNGRPVDELDMDARGAAMRASSVRLTIERDGETIEIEMRHDDAE